MDCAFIKHAQHQVHGDHRRQHQPQGIGQRRLEGRRRALQAQFDAGRHGDVLARRLDGGDGRAQRAARRQVEREIDGRELGQVVHRQRHGALADRGQRRQRNRLAVRGFQVDALQRLGAGGQARVHFQHHAILVRLREQGGHLALAEGVVERLGHVVHGQAEPRGGVARDLQVGLAAAALQVRRNIGQLRRGVQALGQRAAPARQQGGVGRGQGELVLAAADAVFDVQFLHRLQVQRDAPHLAGAGIEPRHDVGQRRAAFAPGLEVDQQAAGIQRGVHAVDADEGRQAGDVGILQQALRQRLLALRHGLERGALRRLGHALQHAAVLRREEALGHRQVQQRGQRDGGQHRQQRQALVAQGHVEPAGVARLQAVQQAGRALGVRRQQARAHHGGERQRHRQRDQDGHRQRDGEFAEQPADHVFHEQQRDQHGDQRQRQRHQGEADLPGALERGRHRAVALFAVAGDVLQHDDGVVDHEAGADGQRHQRQVVGRKARQVHHAEGADQGQRHRQAGNQRGRQVAQEQEGHQHHQPDREGQFPLHAAHRSADALGAVGQHAHLHRRRQAGGQLRQQRLDLVGHGDDVGAGLALDVHQHRRLAVDPGGQVAVLGAVLHRGDLAQPHRRAIAPGHDQVAVFLRAPQLVVGVHDDRTHRAVEAALGLVGVGLGDGLLQVGQLQSARGQRHGVGLHPHRGALAAGQAYHAHARQLRQALCHAGVDQVVDLRQRQRIRGDGQRQDRHVGRVDLAVHRRRRQVGRQQRAAGADGGLHLLLGHPQRDVERELQRDHRDAAAAGGRHLLEPRDLAEAALQRRGHGARGDIGAGARIGRGDLDDGVVDLRQRRHRQHAPGEDARQQQRQHQERGGDRPQDEGT
ncbi:Uncharacterised protein [Achromobacter xylosoxidans]|nr:Uncharacterised protein [Achromobacter xylosoxidans]